MQAAQPDESNSQPRLKMGFKAVRTSMQGLFSRAQHVHTARRRRVPTEQVDQEQQGLKVDQSLRTGAQRERPTDDARIRHADFVRVERVLTERLLEALKEVSERGKSQDYLASKEVLPWGGGGGGQARLTEGLLRL